MSVPTDPERDPLFRGLVVVMAIALVGALIFDGLRQRTATASAEPAAVATAPAGAMGDMDGMSAEEMAAGHEESMKAYPAKTAGVGDQVLEPTVQGGVKVFELTASKVRWEYAPGQFADGFAYDQQIPGPQIRVRTGDRIRVVLHNQLDQPTTIHWHGVTVPNEDDGVPYVTQDPVMPGQSFTYEFEVKDAPGTYLYHSHFNSTEQVASGLYGAFIVEPKRATWQEEYTEILNDGQLGFTIDGKGWPATAPMTAKLGDDVLIRLANVGQMLHPIHLHGYHFTVMTQDGAALARPYLADTVVVAPGETYDLLVHADQPGVWAMHCHILSHVEGAGRDVRDGHGAGGVVGRPAENGL